MAAPFAATHPAMNSQDRDQAQDAPGTAGAAAIPGRRGRALFTDLYELTMLQACCVQEMHEEAVFSLFVCRPLRGAGAELVQDG